MAEVNRGSVQALLAPWIEFPAGSRRPPVSKTAMRLSLALARDTYQLNVSPWLRQGWQDATFLLNGRLSDVSYSDHDPLIEQRLVRYRRLQVRRRLQSGLLRGNPVDALRRPERVETGKALVMAYVLPGGRALAAISFMGTGKRLADWAVNFCMEPVEEEHLGYRRLVEQFEAREADIRFPDTARLLGRPSLTLADMLKEAEQPDSPFRFWLAGHSQGAAVMQLWCRRKIRQGIPRERFVGWGFASPSAVTPRGDPAPFDYPLFHVVNGDDAVPRMGMGMHLGLILLYPGSRRMREESYHWPQTEEAREARALLQPLLARLKDTRACLLSTAAMAELVIDMKPEELLHALHHLRSLRLEEAADERLDGVLRRLLGQVERNWRLLEGVPMPRGEIDAWKDDMRPALGQLGLQRFLRALWELFIYPHNCSNPAGSYQWIVSQGADELIPMWWTANPPCLRRRIPENDGLLVRKPVRRPRKAYPLPGRRQTHA